MIQITKINTVSGTQARTSLNQEIVSEYADAYRSGASMPPVIVFFDGSTYYLADGFHRYFAAKEAGVESIVEEVIPGTLRDAILYSLSANSKHGLRRSNEDKRKAVSTLLDDPEWSTWSDRKIADACAVSHPFVAAIRNPEAAQRQNAQRVKNAQKGDNQEVHTNHVCTNEHSEITLTVESDSTSTECSPTTPPVWNPIPPEEESAPGSVSPQVVTFAQGAEVSQSQVSMKQEMMQDAMDALRDENESLRNQLAAMLLDGGDDEKAELLNRLNELTEKNKQLEIVNESLVVARDRVMAENVNLRKQCEMNAKKLRKVA